MKKTLPKFKKTETFHPQNEKEQLLVRAFDALKTEEDIANFLRDILTLPEINEFANRLTIAKLLLEGISYLTIAKKIGASTTTVTRVAHWLYNGCGGYQKVFKSLKSRK
ncbi:hypothetical protein HY214_02880 [Candidatus Roizmanbacteria bacterium]|nr:hypothetical protein [Candidatus Roizmanbacteria bacterium]